MPLSPAPRLPRTSSIACRLAKAISTLLVITLVLIVDANAASSGALDVSFGERGTAISDIESRALILQPDGKVVVAGYVITCPAGICSSNFRLVRFNSDGTADTGFGENGVVTTDHFSQDEAIFAAALQADGKIVVAGGYNDVSNAADFSGFKVFRYLPNGTLDGTFGEGGRVYENFDEMGGTPDSMFIQSDGKIVVAGSDTTFHLFVVRFNVNGSVDTSFANGGRIASSSYNIANVKISRQENGNIVLVGRSTPTGAFKLIRLHADGSLDSSFGANGVVTSAFSIATSETIRMVLAVQSDGKILVSGGHLNGPRIPPLRRFNSDGSVDATLVPDPGPVAMNQCKRCTQSVAKIIPLAEGKFFLVGIYRSLGSTFSPDNKPPRMAITRYFSNGSIDPSFAYKGTSFARHARDMGSNTSFIQSVGDAAMDAAGRVVMISDRYTTRVHLDLTPGSVHGDFDGDGRTDIGVFRPANGSWWVKNSSDGTFRSIRWGLADDEIVPGDYDYDLKADFSVVRPSNNFWYTFSQPAPVADLFGQTGDIRVTEDFDGDGLADQAAFGTNGWAIRNTSENIRYSYTDQGPDPTFTWGLATDIPVPADYDGDGRADLAVFRPSTGVWYVFRSSDDQYTITQFGLGTDKLVPADYDGDGRTDIAVFRDGIWYVQLSSDGSYYGVNWGFADDIAAPGDYDGDGKYDVAVYRPSEGVWYVLNSSDGGFTATFFGLNGDVPIPSYSVR